jgi:hypothetical protein
VLELMTTIKNCYFHQKALTSCTFIYSTNKPTILDRAFAEIELTCAAKGKSIPLSLCVHHQEYKQR